MYLKRAQHSRLKKQWRFLSKQLKQLTEQGKFQQLASTKKAFLLGRLKQLFQQMLRFEKVGHLKKALGAAALLLGLQAIPLQAQVTFGPLVSNPFGLTYNYQHGGNSYRGILADIDNDGDLDIITLKKTPPESISLWENMSTDQGTVPHFAEPVSNFAGLVLPELDDENSFNKLEFGDLDNDEDLDLIISSYAFSTNKEGEAQLYYFDNIGDANTPVFAEAILNPFGIDLNESIFPTPHLIDLDGDGDLDLMDVLLNGNASWTFQYLENIGTAEVPNFAPAQLVPFGLPAEAAEYIYLDFGDIDNDGDIDIVAGDRSVPYSYGDFFDFIENIGTPENPQFATPVEGPFSVLTIGPYAQPLLGDLDNDGDLDILGTPHDDFNGNGITWSYRENLLDPVATNEPTLAAAATVFPSVSNSVVNLSVQTETVHTYFLINVFAMNGKLLHQHKMAGGTIVNQQIDLSTYPAGQYLIQMRTPEGVLVRRVIKQ